MVGEFSPATVRREFRRRSGCRFCKEGYRRVSACTGRSAPESVAEKSPQPEHRAFVQWHRSEHRAELRNTFPSTGAGCRPATTDSSSDFRRETFHRSVRRRRCRPRLDDRASADPDVRNRDSRYPSEDSRPRSNPRQGGRQCGTNAPRHESASRSDRIEGQERERARKQEARVVQSHVLDFGKGKPATAGQAFHGIVASRQLREVEAVGPAAASASRCLRAVRVPIASWVTS